MITFNDPISVQKYVSDIKKQGKSIGFVPTMGYLHEGHLSLLRAAKTGSDTVALSIFVNPKQFGPTEDLHKYPRDFERDAQLAESVNTDIIFYPTEENMYPPGYSTYVTEESISSNWCGLKRPGHFKGVTTVVVKLLNIIQPDTAYFGAKDIQQALIIKKIVADLNIPVKIEICPIVREEDGLAMSSRNVYLDKNERFDAKLINKSLSHAIDLFMSGFTNSELITEEIKRIILTAKSIEIDYIACVDKDTLEAKDTLTHGDRILIAVYAGKTRLIDNCQLP